MYQVIKTHAKSLGNQLYLKGQILEEIEDAKYKLEKGLIKEFKGKVKTKEEKKTRKRRTK